MIRGMLALIAVLGGFSASESQAAIDFLSPTAVMTEVSNPVPVSWLCQAGYSQGQYSLNAPDGSEIFSAQNQAVIHDRKGNCTFRTGLMMKLSKPIPGELNPPDGHIGLPTIFTQSLPMGKGYDLKVTLAGASGQLVQDVRFDVVPIYIADFSKPKTDFKDLGATLTKASGGYNVKALRNGTRGFETLPFPAVLGSDVYNGKPRYYELTIGRACNAADCQSGLIFGFGPWASTGGISYYQWIEAVLDHRDHLVIREVAERQGSDIVRLLKDVDVSKIINFDSQVKIGVDTTAAEGGNFHEMSVYIDGQRVYCDRGSITPEYVFGAPGIVATDSTETLVTSFIVQSSAYVGGRCRFEARRSF